MILMIELPFRSRPFIIGMVHLKPLLGSPGSAGGLDEVISNALRDLRALQEGGIDGVLVENLGDVPYFKDPSSRPEVIASFSRVICELKKELKVPMGVNLLRNGCAGALSIAEAFSLSYIRVNVLSEAYVTDQGIIEGCGAELLRLRAQLGSKVAILADVHVKHSYPMLQRKISEAARDVVERGLADAVIVTGSRTGSPPSQKEIRAVKEAVKVPVIVGSGLTEDNASDLLKYADGAIVGTYLKRDGSIENEVDVKRVRKLMKMVRG